MAGRMSIQCSSCGTTLSIADETKLGKKIRCPRCSEVFVAKAMTSPSLPSKKKKVRKSDDEFDFEGMEMEDTANSNALPPARRKNSDGRRTASKNSSTSRLPLILAAAGVVLFAGVGVILFFNRTKSNEDSAPLTQDGTLTAPEIANSSPLVTAKENQPVVPQASAVSEKKLGETEEFEATKGRNTDAGISRVLGRTRWDFGLAVDESGQKQDVIELLIDIEGDVLNRTIAIGNTKFTTINVSPGVSLNPFKGFIRDAHDSANFNPYDKNSAGLWGQPVGTLRAGLRFVAPKDPVATLAEVEGAVVLRVGKLAEEITIPDLRLAANKPFAQDSLKTAGAELFLASKQVGNGLAEVLDFRIGKNAAVGRLLVTPPKFPFELQPEYKIDPDGYHFSTRHLVSLPPGPLKMTFKVYKDIEEISVPFRFENMPLPDFAKKGK